MGMTVRDTTMLYLSQMMGKPVVDIQGEKIGTISDLAISTGEVFPRITSLAFQGPGKVPFMISWRKYVDTFDEDGITLNAEAHDIRFSYLQPDEVLLARDLLNRQIVDTQGLKSGARQRPQAVRFWARSCACWAPKWACAASCADWPPGWSAPWWPWRRCSARRSTSRSSPGTTWTCSIATCPKCSLSVTHKRLDELHPADVADILEQLDPQQRANVFQHLDDAQATEAISEMDDEYQADFIEDLDDARAAGLLGDMDPDDAADIVRDLSYEKAETLLRLMGVEDATEIRRLLGYKDGTAGGMMTTQFVAVKADNTVGETIEVLRELDDDHPTVHYVYVLNDYDEFVGVLSLRTLVLTDDARPVRDVMFDDVISATPDETEEDVAADIFKYELPAMPVVDEHGVLLGIVTVDDAWDAIEEDVSGDKTKATLLKVLGGLVASILFLALYTLVLLQIIGYAGR